MGITQEQIDDIKEKLKNMPEVHGDNISKQSAIARLAKEIDALKKRGYGIDSIAKKLTEAGLEISVQTLKCYLHRAKPGAGKKAQKEKLVKTIKPSIKALPEAETKTSKGTFQTRLDSEEI